MYLVMVKEEWETARTFYYYHDAIDYYLELSLHHVVFMAELRTDGSVQIKNIIIYIKYLGLF